MALHQVAPGPYFDFIFEQLFRQFSRNLLVFQPTDLSQEPVAQYGSVGPWQPGGSEYVEQLAFGGDGLADQLADGRINLFRCFPVLAALLVHCRLQGLEETDVITNLCGCIAGGAKGKSTRELSDYLHPAFLAIFLLENVFLPGRDELQTLGGCAANPPIPIENVHHVARNAMFFQHHSDGLRGIESWVALTTALGVSDQCLFQLIGQAEVIHHQSARLVTEHAIYLRDGLHQPVALHRLVDIHGVQTGRVEPG